jgi:hypothetical protein
MRTILPAILAAAAALPAGAQEAPGNPIDRHFARVWADRGLTPAPPAGDYEFLRRATLDVLGRPPRPEEIRAFEKDPDRGRAIEKLLAHPDAAEFFADTWLRILLNYRFEETLPLKINFPAFRAYLKEVYARDLPYREFAAQLLSDHGDNVKKPASNFVLAALDPHEPPHEIASRTARVFLGLQIQCARCHDHPFDNVTREDFWGLAAFFGGLKPKARTTFEGFGVKLTREDRPGAMAMKVPDSDLEVGPTFLDGRRPEPGEAPAAALARFVTGSPAFSRAIVNRVWAHFMGRGFFEPIDRYTERTRVSHPELLGALVEEFERGGTRLQPLFRLILRSRAYQTSCAAPAGESPDPEAFLAMPLKPQNPVQLLNTLTWVLRLDGFLDQFYRQYLKAFGDDTFFAKSYGNAEVFRMYLHLYAQSLLAPSQAAPEASTYTGSVRLALKLMNSPDLQGLVRAEAGPLADILKREPTEEGRLVEIFLTLLSRPPDGRERERYLAYIRRKGGRPPAYEDVYWTLLNSTELFFNH